MAEQFADAELLGGIVFDDEQTLAARRGVILDAGERGVQSFGRGRLGDEGKCAARQAVVPVFVERQHLHGNVARGRILLQMIEHGPAQHVGQEDIERDGGGMEFARQRKCFGAAQRDQNLESVVARQVAEHARVVRIVLDDQQDRIVRLQIVAVVLESLRSALLHRRDWQRRLAVRGAVRGADAGSATAA